MDAIALLCTLHAEGPTTLKRLRARGCTTLADLRALEPETLAGLLDCTPAGARRFLREAAGLADRLGAAALEAAPVAGEPAVAAAGEAAEPVRAGAVPAEPVVAGVGLSQRERGLIDRVLDRWREAEREPAAPLPAAAPPRRAAGRAPSGLPPIAAPVRPARAVGEAALAPGALEGLDTTACAALRARGVATVAELARLDDGALLALGPAGLRFTRASRLRYLARRALEPDAAGPAQPAPASAAAPAVTAAAPAAVGAAVGAARGETRFSAREAAEVAPVEQPALGAYELRPYRPDRPAALGPIDGDAIDDPAAGDAAGPFA